MEGKRLITIEGGIASGKTTLGNAIAETGRAAFLCEPISDWQSKYSANILDLFYKDKERFSYLFQNCAFLSRAKTWDEILNMTDHSTVFTERSIFSDKFVFAKMLHESGDMLDIEWELYCDMWKWLNERWCCDPDKIVYVKTSPETCLDRIVNKRARGEEISITIDYLRLLEDAHNSWLTNDQEHVIIVDGESEICVDSLLDKLGIE